MQNAVNAESINSNNDRNNLADIRDVKIDTSLPLGERMKSYIQQIGNPYLYKCGDITVRISFANTDITLEDRIKQLLMAPCTS
jgi:hypothetical protein